jgi:cytoskeletal protein CcmA (bactofilin family)
LTGATGGFYPAPGRRDATTRHDDSREPDGKPTVVAVDASVEGGIQGGGDLVVQGVVRGHVQVGGGVTVASTGAVEADVVAGGTVRLEADSRVVGDIRAPRVVIVDGASFRGAVDTGGPAPARTHDASAADAGGEPGPDAGLAAFAVRVAAPGK